MPDDQFLARSTGPVSPIVSVSHINVDFKNRVVTQKIEERFVKHQDDNSAVLGNWTLLLEIYKKEEFLIDWFYFRSKGH